MVRLKSQYTFSGLLEVYSWKKLREKIYQVSYCSLYPSIFSSRENMVKLPQQWFLNCNIHTHHLEIILICHFSLGRSGEGSTFLRRLQMMLVFCSFSQFEYQDHRLFYDGLICSYSDLCEDFCPYPCSMYLYHKIIC